MLMGQSSCICYKGYQQPFQKFVRGDQRILATIKQIFYRVSEVFTNSLKNSSERIDNFCKHQIFVTGLPIPSDPLPEGIGYPPEQLAEGI
jgi:hypothetical protein